MPEWEVPAFSHFSRLVLVLLMSEQDEQFGSFRIIYKHQGGVTPIDTVVTAATAGQSFDRCFWSFDR